MRSLIYWHLLLCAGVSSQGARFLAKGREFAKSFYCKNFANKLSVGWARFLCVKSTHSSNLDQKGTSLMDVSPKLRLTLEFLTTSKMAITGSLWLLTYSIHTHTRMFWKKNPRTILKKPWTSWYTILEVVLKS